MKKIVTFGEIMLRLAPEGYKRFVQADKLCMEFGGSEANVAVALASFGMCPSFVSKMPQNEISQTCINKLRGLGVDTRHIKFGGDRLGLYFVEKGASQRPSKVIYDRKNSSFSQSELNDYDWDDILKDASWLHITGITPALSNNCADICLQACKKAKELNITVSCDLNYRKKLWTSEQANAVMSKICEYVDICVANEEDAFAVFGIKSEKSTVENGVLDYEDYKTVAKTLCNKFGFSKVAMTLRSSVNANINKWTGLLFDKQNFYLSKEYSVQIVDRVGSGDAFCAGLIYALQNNLPLQECIDFATASGCLKHSIEGDFNLTTATEVFNLAGGNGSGRVIR